MTDVVDSRDITLVRTFAAPQEKVFALWTEAKHLERWWGPDGFTAPYVVSDPVVGGELTITMEGPGGFSETMRARYREVVAQERIVVESVVSDAEGKPMIQSSHEVTFVAKGSSTEVTVHARASVFNKQTIAALNGMSAGWNQSLQCLDDLVNGTNERMVIHTRLYDAAPLVVFPLWTEPQHMASWWGPDGFSITISSMDVRQGGTWDFIMHAPDGTDFPNRITYDEVFPPNRLVFTHHTPGIDEPTFSMIVTFDEVDGKTALTLRQVFESTAARDELEANYGAFEGAKQTLNKLGTHLASLSSVSTH